MVAAWEVACGPLGQYGMRHTRALANLCNAGLGPGAVAEALGGGVCSGGALLA
jgi:legumain